jgi:hypothetical protein
VNYRLPLFYSFGDWVGIEQELDTGGGFAYLMLLLYDSTVSAGSTH